MMMDAASTFMSETLDNVLSLQRIEEGKFELDMAPFSLVDLLGHVTAMYGGVFREKDIEMEKIVDRNIPACVFGDRGRISHIISNLLSNALKFSPKGETITLSCSVQSIIKSTDDLTQTATISISVTDRGFGISEENQAKLFNNFVQIRPTTLQNGQVTINFRTTIMVSNTIPIS
jgi:signal transduction histidine kinase